MITPRRTRLIRAADPHAFRRAVAILSLESSGPSAPASPLVVVPTRGAAQQLGRTIQIDAVTREQLYDRLHARLPEPPPRLTTFEREVMMRAASGEAATSGAPAPFQLRPGLVAEMVRFYDQLRRQGQTVTRFEELLADNLARDSDFDRGAERMLRQTYFLAAVFRAYERRLSTRAAVDEHALRDRLLHISAPEPVRQVIVTVGDWIADPHGLHAVDFDLLTRLPGLASIDLVVGAEMLASGLHQRVHDWLPGIEEVDARSLGAGPAQAPPVIIAAKGSADAPFFVSRDREEELVRFTRRVRASQPADLDRVAVVFKRPLPYLYLAREVFAGAGLPYHTFDALPLAAEPFAAALDVVVEFVSSQFTRESATALLRSPHFDLSGAGRRDPHGPLSPAAIAALDRGLSAERYLGELDRLRALATAWAGDEAAPVALNAAWPALKTVIAAAEALQPLLEGAPASAQLRRLSAFLASHVRAADALGDPASAARQLRARAAIVNILESLADAYAGHDDRDATIDELAPDIRRWIEDETFVPDSPDHGIQLLDAEAARYGDFDEAVLVGLIEGEWPERPRRNIFYPPALLASLGWPSEKDRRGAQTAAFVDLLQSPNLRIALSTFTLDDEALVEPSSLLEEIGRARLDVVEVDAPPPDRIFLEDALSLEPPELDLLAGEAADWAAFRLARTPQTDAAFHGQAGPRPAKQLSVSAIETYLTCPFKFFAQHVLRLEDEPDDDEVMDPRKQGQFIHSVFEKFFSTWQRRGHRSITPDNLDVARALFSDIVEEAVTSLPDAEASLERTRLLGSGVAAGLGEIVFRMEAERPIEVVERLLEYKLDGEFELAGADGPRRVALRGIADRLDLLADGTFRLIDYKLSSAPSKSRVGADFQKILDDYVKTHYKARN